jgi:hypothetical protein
MAYKRFPPLTPAEAVHTMLTTQAPVAAVMTLTGEAGAKAGEIPDIIKRILTTLGGNLPSAVQLIEDVLDEFTDPTNFWTNVQAVIGRDSQEIQEIIASIAATFGKELPAKEAVAA